MGPHGVALEHHADIAFLGRYESAVLVIVYYLFTDGNLALR
jgi:hypothetical protein